jgi:two-component system sensor histidine kinase UhpB
MKFRTHVNLIVASLSAVFIVTLLAVELDHTRRAVHEEIAAANIVATRLLSRVAETYGEGHEEDVQRFLHELGRVRANEIRLVDADDTVIYRSPAATYKAGRKAPAWFERWLMPQTPPHVVELPDHSRLIVEANASRAILDGWDDGVELMWVGGLAFLGLNALVFWLVGRAVAPLPVIAEGLKRIEEGELAYRLPPLHGEEASSIGAAFNHMAESVQERWRAEGKVRAAETRLRERRELDDLIERRLHEERQLIARELHDEFSQSVTAIRTLALVVAGRSAHDERITEAAQLIATEAGRLYDAMRGLIPRLTPLALDTFSLAETLDALVNDWRRRHPSVSFRLHHELTADIDPSVSLAIYRIVQEGVTNAVRHANPRHVEIDVRAQDDRVLVHVTDDGVGLPNDWAERGRFGLRGLRERIAKLDGTFIVRNRSKEALIYPSSRHPTGIPVGQQSESSPSSSRRKSGSIPFKEIDPDLRRDDEGRRDDRQERDDGQEENQSSPSDGAEGDAGAGTGVEISAEIPLRPTP